MKKALKGSAFLGPLPPALVSCRQGEKTNIITIAWTGILNSHPPKTYVSVRPTRFSYNMIRESGEFVINLSPRALLREVDYCGTYTGAKVDKFAVCGFTPEYYDELGCPGIAECPVSVTCKVSDVIPLGSHDMFVADILGVHVDEQLFDREGKIHMERADLMAFLHGEYYALGARLGDIGCGIVKKGKK